MKIRGFFAFGIVVSICSAKTLLTVKHGCARVNRAPLCDPDWTTWAFNWLTGNIQTSDSAEVNPSGVIVVAGFRPYSPEPNETPKCWQTLKIPGNPPPARIYLSVDAGDYCLYKSWSFGFKADKVLDAKGAGVCCREMEDNKALPNPYLWILGGPHADAGSNSQPASGDEQVSKGLETTDSSLGASSNLVAPQMITADSQSRSDRSQPIAETANHLSEGADPNTELTTGTDNDLVINAETNGRFDAGVGTKNKRVVEYFFRA